MFSSRYRDLWADASSVMPELVGPEQVARLDRIGIILFQLGSPALVEEDTGRAEALVQEMLEPLPAPRFAVDRIAG